MTTVYVTHPRYVEHTLPGHPENARRIQAVWDVLRQAELIERLKLIEPQPVDPDLILTVHTPEYLETLSKLASQNGLFHFDPDTYALPVSFEIAQLSAGGAVCAVDAVLRGEADNGLAVVRPPGHHARPSTGMGFCLLGNIAIAARFAQRAYHVERILILDFDVHHGNGTQEMFYDDDSVLYISTHQYPFYPGTGKLTETGVGRGLGYTLNIPLPARNGDSNYAHVCKQLIWPMVRRFQPQLVLVSAGFDAHHRDPLAMMALSLHGFARMTRELIKMAEEFCDGKIVFVLEGGYDLEVLGHGVRNIAHALLGERQVSDPIGRRPITEPNIDPIIERLKLIHKLGEYSNK